MTSIASFAKAHRTTADDGVAFRVARSITAAGTRFATSVRMAQELRDATSMAERRRLAEQHFAARRAA